MSKIRSSNTQFENDFIAELKKKTRKKFRMNVRNLTGKPDVVFQKERVCVFLDSDFWHGWRYSRWEQKLNDYWKRKIADTIKRDRRTSFVLRKQGWKVIRIWGHQIRHAQDKIIQKILSEI